MMQNNISIQGLTKNFKDFRLDRVSFDVPAGCVVGFIGENGAGKSTTIKSVLGLIRPDGGQISVFGREELTEKEKGEIGAVLGENCLPENLTLKDVSKVMRLIFHNWNEGDFFSFSEKFRLPTDKRIKEFSRGMQQKAALAVALSHGARLLVLDEPTSGLDPVARDEILDILYDFMQDEKRSILISSHILSDLEKLCDYIVFIHGGKIIFSEEKDSLYGKYAIFRGAAEECAALGDAAKAYIRGDFGISALVLRDKVPAGMRLEKANIEDIMLYYSRGERL